MMPPRRKKWTEEEERTLIEKYGEMLTDGTLNKMKTREKKFRPIAAQVNSLHHALDPVAFPWQWTWKDASTKVQNMRHQYLLVKQKIKKPPNVNLHHHQHHHQLQQQQHHGLKEDGEEEVEEEEEELVEEDEFDWVEGLTHWPNFLRYKNVFGDVALAGFSNNGNNTDYVNHRSCSRNYVSSQGRSMEVERFGHLGPEDGFCVGIDGGENGVLGLGLGFDYDGEEGDENINNNNNHLNHHHHQCENDNGVSNHVKEDDDDGFEYEEVDPIGYQARKKRKKMKGSGKRMWALLSYQFARLREREAQYEDREVERERERRRIEQIRAEVEKEHEQKLKEREEERDERKRSREKIRMERLLEWEAMEKESVERERRRREEELLIERQWEERMERRRLDWKKSMDNMLNQHRVAMEQVQSRILHDQQTVISQLLGSLSQWTGHPTGLSDHTGAGNPYLSQMLHNLHHVNEMVHNENRVEADSQDHQFIVDG